ncbi:hypothetical protein HanRHA438_Chr01g0040661 [Helianthus annuus]|uniref:KIB1-4 beta-propeller domain-containing protein n=1 Tax=Helianthus annuus TaxID=4232 RepID=A0A9K3JZP4_HELAN|nr:hypothetical protein HanXRQr2_Chr01g0039791 [Helianthus annuus]KAJ0628281.1 hypothetical protein HanHA89_Chr01g0034931 [Helianthus annuus]KAJ0784565.1 hypothetical protein HanLR1_Chr01g0033401 [Helianthus annuus]KAJ0949623.1 hypothetical protein HanRHA438_Chr01g0040661 [Helianthus annuus]
MEPKQNTSSLAYDQKLPPMSAKYPWFIAQNPQSDYQIFYTINNPEYHYLRRINELHGRQIRACFHGWMILTDHPGKVVWSLWNPLTSKLIRLPPLFHKQRDSHECCLSSPPYQTASVFLLTSIKIPTIVFYRLELKRQRLKWTEMSYAKQLKRITGVDCCLRCLTCCNGKVYAMTSAPDCIGTHVIHVDIMATGKSKEVVISLLPLVKVPPLFNLYLRCPSYNSFRAIKSFLKGSSTELFYIVVCFKDETRIGDVYLFKLDMTSVIWEEMVDLKDAIIFMELASDHCYCYMSIVDSKIGGYIHILGNMGKVIYSFYVKDRTLSLSYMPCLVQQCHVSAWAMLEYRYRL